MTPKKKTRKIKPGRRAQGRPPRGEADSIDLAIRRAAVDVLLEHGEKATMSEIAVAACLTRKTVYARYNNKSDLFLDAVSDLLARTRVMAIPVAGSVEERLLAYLRTSLELVAMPQSRAIQRLLVLNPTFVEALQAGLYNAREQNFVKPLTILLSEAHANRELRVAEPERVARAIVNLFHAESLMLDPDRDTQSAEQREDYARFLAKLFIDGLRISK